MKKILLSIGLVVVCSFLNAQTPDQYFAGTVTTPGQLATNSGSFGTVVLITTNRANVHSIQLSSASTGIIKLFDSGNTNVPFYGVKYTNAAYWTTVFNQTNLVGSNGTAYISPLTGTTNYFTNVGIYTFSNSVVANTNDLNTTYSAAFTANIATIQMPLNLTFSQGIVLWTTTNVNYSIGYTP